MFTFAEVNSKRSDSLKGCLCKIKQYSQTMLKAVLTRNLPFYSRISIAVALLVFVSRVRMRDDDDIEDDLIYSVDCCYFAYIEVYLGLLELFMNYNGNYFSI